jgi:colanic acid/amylovoran biosynthesis glycosyltransferase
MRRVLVFKETLLEPSETFILAQMRGLSEYLPILAGLERACPSLPLPQDPLLLSDCRPVISNLRAKIYRRAGIAPRFHHRARRSRPDLIHAHFASGGRHALPLARALCLPLLVTFHGADVTVRGSQPDIYKQLCEHASIFICVSEFIRDRAIEAGFPPHKLIVHYIGVDRDLFSSSSSPQPSQSVLFVGRLVEKKGCEYLLRAMKLVQQSHPECELTVIGDGPLRARLETLGEELNVRCRFLGIQPASTVREALRRAQIFCVPSVTAANGDSEGLGMVFAEAQAMGVPVVSTRHGGIPEVVFDRINGLLVPERDHEALADSLCLLLGNEDLWRAFRAAGLQHVEKRFDLKHQTTLLEGVYNRVLTTK